MADELRNALGDIETRTSEQRDELKEAAVADMTDADPDSGTDLNIGAQRGAALDKMGLSNLGVDGEALMDNVTSAKDALGSMTDGLGQSMTSITSMFGVGMSDDGEDAAPPMFNYAAEMKRFDGARPVTNPFNIVYNVIDAGDYMKGMLMSGKDCQGKDLRLGDRYFVRSGTCGETSEPACRDQPRYLYVDNVPSGALPCSDPDQPSDPNCAASNSGLVGGVLTDIVSINPFEVGASLMGAGSAVNDRCVLRTEEVGDTTNGFVSETKCAPERAAIRCNFKLAKQNCRLFDLDGTEVPGTPMPSVPPYARGIKRLPDITNLEFVALLNGFVADQTRRRVALMYEGGGGEGGGEGEGEGEGGAEEEDQDPEQIVVGDEDAEDLGEPDAPSGNVHYVVPATIAPAALDRYDEDWRALCVHVAERFAAYVRSAGNAALEAAGSPNRLSSADAFQTVNHCMEAKEQCERGHALYVWTTVFARHLRHTGFQVRFAAACPTRPSDDDDAPNKDAAASRAAYEASDVVFFANAVRESSDDASKYVALAPEELRALDPTERAATLVGNPTQVDLEVERSAGESNTFRQVEGFASPPPRRRQRKQRGQSRSRLLRRPMRTPMRRPMRRPAPLLLLAKVACLVLLLALLALCARFP
jgi:hypothetical protein